MTTDPDADVTPEKVAAIQRMADMEWAAEVYERFRTTQLTEATRRYIMPHKWDELPLHWRELLAFTYSASRVENERLRAALSSSESWIDRWTSHVGTCEGGNKCTCGRSAVLYEAGEALHRSRSGARSA